MKPAAFGLVRPDTLETARAALGPGEAKAAAGTQSLGPMLNLRLARPARLVDLSGLAVLKDVRILPGGGVRIGAGITHAQIEDGELPVEGPLGAMLRHVAGGIAYRAVRTRGTIGGSLAHADPAADWVSTMTALDARLIILRSNGPEEACGMTDFMAGAYRTVLGNDGLLVAVEIEGLRDASCWGYAKLCRKVGEFADAIGAVVIDPDRRMARIVAGSTGGRPAVLPDLARIVATTGTVPDRDTIAAALVTALGAIAPVKKQQLTVALERAIKQVIA
jgi:carbon-monoxide dehydrogenase medium subunit